MARRNRNAAPRHAHHERDDNARRMARMAWQMKLEWSHAHGVRISEDEFRTRKGRISTTRKAGEST